MRDAIEGKRFDAQNRFFRRAVTSRFGGAQFVITPEEAFYAGCVACPARHAAPATNRQDAEDAEIEQTTSASFVSLSNYESFGDLCALAVNSSAASKHRRLSSCVSLALGHR